MKLIPVLATIAVLGGSAWILWSRSVRARIDPPRSSATPEPSGSYAKAPGTPAEPSLTTTDSPSVPQRESAPTPAIVEEQVATPPRTRILGRLVDENGTPLPGIQVVADSVGEPWAEGVHLPEITIRGHKMEALAATTDAAGRFELEAPLPTADWIDLFVEPDDFHGILSKNFGPAGGRDQPRLVAGDNDLGDLSLATTGTVEGSVHGSEGRPVAGADVSLHGAYPGGLSVSTRTENDGRFRLAHVPPGSWRFGVRANGRISATSDSVEVRPRQVSREVQFVLVAAPSISGVVIDESGQPVPRVSIQAWPRSSGEGGSATSAKDGAFTLYLPQDDSYRLDIEHDGFESYGGFTSDLVAPGTTDLRIVLKRGTSMVFLVVDEETGEPIERYGIDVQEVGDDEWNRSEDSRPVRIGEHPGGESRIALPRGKCVVHVEAPDHAAAGPDVAEDPAAKGRQTIRLARGSELSGRALHAGSPVAGARVQIERCSVKVDASQPDEPEDDRWFSENYRFDLSPFVGRSREAMSGADGRFHFGSLAAGTYSLTLRESRCAPLTRAGLTLGAERAVDLGDLVLEPGSAIRGRLLLPPGRTPQGWEVILDEGWPRGRQEPSADGRFVFDGLNPGKHTLGLRPPEGQESVSVRELLLPPGKTVEVELDASALLPGELRVRVTRAGRPVSGARVRWGCGDRDAGGRELGAPTDEDGRTSNKVSPCPAMWLEAASAAGLRLARARDPIAILPDTLAEAEIEITVGELTLLFPESFQIPEKGQAYVSFRTPDESEQDFQQVMVATRDVPFADDAIEWTSRSVDLGLVAPGEYEVTVQVSEGIPRDLGGSNHIVLEPRGSFRARIHVERDGRTACALVPVEGR